MMIGTSAVHIKSTSLLLAMIKDFFILIYTGSLYSHIKNLIESSEQETRGSRNPSYSPLGWQWILWFSTDLNALINQADLRSKTLPD